MSLQHRDGRHAAPGRLTVLWIAGWSVGIAAWLVLSFAAGAAPMASPVAPEAAKPGSGTAPSLRQRLKPTTPSPSRSALTPVRTSSRATLKAGAATDVYRMFNRSTGVHFYTASASERAFVLATWPQFADEGVVWRALSTSDAGTVTVWRFFNRDTGAHFYTASDSERARILATWPQFADEGAVYHAYPDDAADRLPVHRFYNTQTRTHFYTADEAEKDLVLRTWPWFAYEGIAYYALAPSPGPQALARRDAFRLVDQATFGATPAEVDRAVSMGAAAWVEDQFARASSGYPKASYFYESLDESTNCSFSAARDTAIYRCAVDQLTLFKLRAQFFTNALSAPDQLRQRVAWALSQIFVVSGMKDPDMETAYVQARWHQMLADNAFGNFEGLLYDITRSPAMGHYLDMVDNAKADPEEGTEPNENFARELLQLFSIGTYELKRDGTPLLDALGQPVPTYGQPEVKAFARAFTGWTYAPYPGMVPKHDERPRYYGAPMEAEPSLHDTGAKRLLMGLSLPPGQAPDSDVRGALRNVFLHPNVGPFIGRQLIRHLVTGSPTPAYVDRVAAVFENDGTGMRGNLKAVVRAILLDPEARSVPDANPRYGRFRDPASFVTAFLRGAGAQSDGIWLDEVTRAMGQNVYYAPSVFNYFPAEYRIPGTDVVAPPMGIHNTNTVLARSNFVHAMLWWDGIERDDEVPGSIGTHVTIAPWVALAADTRKLVAALDDRFFGGGMPPATKATLYDTLARIDDADERARTGLFLVATSFQFQVAR
ncbi:MAG: DUF1800 domain-containing protein [Burkholderiales bacterium]|nr:DUF1800 domain-containing protein [Burkholderiales bacterium]